MKTILFILALLNACPLFSQVPLAFNYQAIARNNNGIAISNQFIQIRFIIKDVSPSGNTIYQETDTTTTNPLGLFTTEIGKGNAQIGTFAGINWAVGNKFLNIAFDPTGGTNFTDMGTTQLISVPYALYADSTGKSPKQNISLSNDTLSLSQGNGVVLPYNSMTNFVVRINGVAIKDSSINDMMMLPYQFITATNYQFEYIPGQFFSPDSAILFGLELEYYSTTANCSLPYYVSATGGGAVRPGIMLNVPNLGVGYIPISATPVIVTSLSFERTGACDAATGTGVFYQVLPNNPSITGFNLSTSALISFLRH